MAKLKCYCSELHPWRYPISMDEQKMDTSFHNGSRLVYEQNEGIPIYMHDSDPGLWRLCDLIRLPFEYGLCITYDN